SHADTYYVLDELQTQPGGYLGEGISCPDTSDEFELLREGYFGVVAGHDHRNGFVGEHEGLLLIATPTCGFNTYGPAPAKRATRLIEFDIRHPYEPRTQLLEFGELVGKPSSKRAYTYAVNQTAPGEGEGDDLLRKPSLWSQLSGLFR
ncbi:serine/threonine protein phosphatase, partial [Bifidobacterium longum]